MGSLISRIERLESVIFGDTIQTGSIDSKHVKVNDEPIIMEIEYINGETQCKISQISQGEQHKIMYYIKGSVNHRANFILSKERKYNPEKITWISTLGGDDIDEVMNEFFRIKGSQETKQPEISDETKVAIKNIEDLQSKFSEEVDEIIKSFDKDWKVSYQLKPEISLTTSTLTLGTTINVFNAKDSKVVNNAKKMGLLDLWFNKVIKY